MQLEEDKNRQLVWSSPSALLFDAWGSTSHFSSSLLTRSSLLLKSLNFSWESYTLVIEALKEDRKLAFLISPGSGPKSKIWSRFESIVPLMQYLSVRFEQRHSGSWGGLEVSGSKMERSLNIFEKEQLVYLLEPGWELRTRVALKDWKWLKGHIEPFLNFSKLYSPHNCDYMDIIVKPLMTDLPFA